MAWHVVSFPSSARQFLRKNRAGDFSPVQKIRAAIQLYATLPLYSRLRLAREYMARCRAKQEDQPPAARPGHDHSGAKLERFLPPWSPSGSRATAS
jgi:hypothetical protein